VITLSKLLSLVVILEATIREKVISTNALALVQARDFNLHMTVVLPL